MVSFYAMKWRMSYGPSTPRKRRDNARGRSSDTAIDGLDRAAEPEGRADPQDGGSVEEARQRR